MKWLWNKQLIIIGGTSGMGLSAANACIKEGAKVVVVGNNPEQGEEAGKQFHENGLVITGEATDEKVVDQAINICLREFGDLNGLYHVAGGSGRRFGDGPIHEMTLHGWQQTLDLNLTTMMISNRAAIKYFMEKQQGGAILNMGSVMGYSPSPKYFATHAYAAAKSAVIGLSKSLAAYYAPQNIRVNVIAPGLMKTPMSQRAVSDDAIVQFIHTKQPLDGGRAGLPEDTDGAAVFLLSDHSRFITGQVIAVDGGWSVTEGQF